MASPAKPMKKDWRNICFDGTGRPEQPKIVWIGCECWGSDNYFSGKYPRNGDLSVLDAMRDLRLGRPVDRTAVLKAFEERNFKPGIPMGANSQKEIMRLLPIAMDRAAAAKPGNYFVVYWDEGYPVKTGNDSQVKSLLLKRGNELLLLICTWNPKPEKVDFSFDLESLGMTALYSAADEETKQSMDFKEGKLSIDLDKYGVMLVRLK